MPVPMTLEQLDVYGSLENVPYSLDNTFYDIGTTVCGPWTLDQLDAFGSLDNLAISLDSSLWTTNACINISDALITANAAVVADANRIRTSSGAIDANADVVAPAIFDHGPRALVEFCHW